jgi:hypothetical protein
VSGERVVVNLYFWGIVASVAFVQVFFEDVDFTPTKITVQ